MEIVFLGTSAGMPTKARNVSGLAIRRENAKKWCLVDCGEGTQQQILQTKLSLARLQAIFITHVHGDHCYGLPGLLASAAMQGRVDPLWIIGPSGIKTFIEVMQTATHLNLTYELKYKCIDESNTTLDDLAIEFDVTSVELSHRVPSFAYRFSENRLSNKLDTDKLTRDNICRGALWGELQQGLDIQLNDGRTVYAQDYLLPIKAPRQIIISGDNDDPSLLTELVKTANVLVHEATYTEDIAIKVGKGPQHCSAKMTAQFAHDMNIDNLVLTHFSPRYQNAINSSPSIVDIENEARAVYNNNLFLAKDLDCFILNKQGVLDKQSILTKSTNKR
ncbi:ribonuclease Z [Moritella sp. 24]|uniref:ribonuclease Z n=1 Tax=Moritella sp. 24 TaxID=2746230 RepID=UPI001BA74969|nr:ribonuclease Z [Moritella sp. 24]QUM77196.1 ribonuclease Z [Moritella sp. 24]